MNLRASRRWVQRGRHPLFTVHQSRAKRHEGASGENSAATLDFWAHDFALRRGDGGAVGENCPKESSVGDASA